MQAETGQFLEPYLGPLCGWLYTDSYWWTALGFAGNILFGSRFIFQWLASERRHELVVPAYFWHLSFWGSVCNLIYVLHLDNAPLILGVIALPFIYGRNLVLLHRHQAPVNGRELEPPIKIEPTGSTAELPNASAGRSVPAEPAKPSSKHTPPSSTETRRPMLKPPSRVLQSVS